MGRHVIFVLLFFPLPSIFQLPTSPFSPFIHPSPYQDQCRCKHFTKDMQSVVVMNTMGDLGNKMFIYVVLHILRVKYGLDVYVTENVVLHLREYFENVSEIPIAERSLCGFKKFWKEFERRQRNEMILYARNKIKERKNQTPDFFTPEKSDDLVSVLHSPEAYGIKLEIGNELLSYTSFPWQEFEGDLRQLEKVGKAYFVYPLGISLQAFDQIFNDDLDSDVPDLVDFTINAFTFKKDLQETSDDNLRTIGNHFREKNKNKFRKRKDITYVGVHHRRGDHIDVQKEISMVPLEPGYFLEAMDMYREKYKRVVFIYVSDDMDWGKEKLKNRIKTNDFYLAGSLQNKDIAKAPFISAAYDLALLSACNHTITSYGTYSFWAGFLAGKGRGKRITPAFFMKYRKPDQISKFYDVPPLLSKLPKFYCLMKNLR